MKYLSANRLKMGHTTKELVFTCMICSIIGFSFLYFISLNNVGIVFGICYFIFASSVICRSRHVNKRLMVTDNGIILLEKKNGIKQKKVLKWEKIRQIEYSNDTFKGISNAYYSYNIERLTIRLYHYSFRKEDAPLIEIDLFHYLPLYVIYSGLIDKDLDMILKEQCRLHNVHYNLRFK